MISFHVPCCSSDNKGVPVEQTAPLSESQAPNSGGHNTTLGKYTAAFEEFFSLKQGVDNYISTNENFITYMGNTEMGNTEISLILAMFQYEDHAYVALIPKKEIIVSIDEENTNFESPTKEYLNQNVVIFENKPTADGGAICVFDMYLELSDNFGLSNAAVESFGRENSKKRDRCLDQLSRRLNNLNQQPNCTLDIKYVTINDQTSFNTNGSGSTTRPADSPHPILSSPI
ncbi:hypothetical protein CL648_01120 [bacterium]|jgi:hypothetical protein|nr:hypothetical protein [bacterium]|tara:strand:+ start:884 stop:1573 length:690 start_codon:yes stop_codon:yes gene_type:complete